MLCSLKRLRSGNFLYCHLLLDRGIHRTHVSLGILEFLNQAMVAFVVFLPNYLSVRFLDFLYIDHTLADDERGYYRRVAYFNLIFNALSVQVHQGSGLGLSDACLVSFHDPAHKF